MIRVETAQAPSAANVIRGTDETRRIEMYSVTIGRTRMLKTSSLLNAARCYGKLVWYARRKNNQHYGKRVTMKKNGFILAIEEAK